MLSARARSAQTACGGTKSLVVPKLLPTRLSLTLPGGAQALRSHHGVVPGPLGPTCSASWCLCSAEVFSSSAILVCCCCTTDLKCLMQLWFGSSSLGISKLQSVTERWRPQVRERYAPEHLAQARHQLPERIRLCRLLRRPRKPRQGGLGGEDPGNKAPPAQQAVGLLCQVTGVWQPRA